MVTQLIRRNNWYIKRIYPDYLIVRDRRNSHHQTTIIFYHNLILIDHLRFGSYGTVLFTSGLIPPTQKLAIKRHIQTLKKNRVLLTTHSDYANNHPHILWIDNHADGGLLRLLSRM